MVNNNKTGRRSSEQNTAFQRLFKGMEVRDAEHDIRVAVLPEDAENATRGDPENCALARACKRQFGTNDALFFRRYAYVAIPDESGTTAVERFQVPQAAYELLANFDLTGERRSGGAFVLKAPTPSNRIEHKRVQDAAYRQAILKGERDVDPKRSEEARKALANRKVVVGQHSLRDGAGMVHFIEAPSLDA